MNGTDPIDPKRMQKISTAAVELNEVSDVLNAEWTALEERFQKLGVNLHAEVEIEPGLRFCWAAFHDKTTGKRRWRFAFARGNDAPEPLLGGPREFRVRATSYVSELLAEMHLNVITFIASSERAAEHLTWLIAKIDGDE